MSLREKIEDNLTVWLLSTLLAGFIAGIGTYKAILEIAQLEVVSRARLEQLQANSSKSSEDEPLREQLDRILGKSNWFVYPDNPDQIGVTSFPSGLQVEEPIRTVETDDGTFAVGGVVPRAIGATVTLSGPIGPNDFPHWQLAALQEWWKAKRNDRDGITRNRINDMFGNTQWVKNDKYPFSAIGKLARDLPLTYPITNVDVGSRKYGVGGDYIHAGEEVTIWVAGEIP